MKLLVVGLLAAALAVLLTIAVVAGYREDQGTIRWFPGTGIAGKVDVIGPQPTNLLITNEQSGVSVTAPVLSDGTFLAALNPGTYRLQAAGDDRRITVQVPTEDCLEIVLDYRIPGAVLRVPGEGWPLPGLATA